MPPENEQEKTEKATPRKRKRAREKGQVVKSMELNSAFILLGGLSLILLLGPVQAKHLVRMSRSFFQAITFWDLDCDTFPVILHGLMKQFLFLVGPFLAVIAVVALAVNLGQVGFLFTLNPLEPKLDKLNPVTGFSRIVSKKTVVEFIKALLKIAVVGWIVYTTIRSQMDDIIPLADTSPREILSFEISKAVSLGLRIGIALLVLAVMDYAYQRSEFEKDLRMSKHELREEYKQMEGNPQFKSRIRNIQRQVAMQRMMKDVPKADVVITNPQHIAVALSYEMQKMPAPRVIAKGENWLAEKIKDVARNSGVPVVENPPLARALFKLVEVGEIIPEKLYNAVAEVLAYVYNLRKKKNEKPL
jgi:flagellar biosynthetic protein FlhB